MKKWIVLSPDEKDFYTETEHEALAYARSKASENYTAVVAEVKYVTVKYSSDSFAITIL